MLVLCQLALRCVYVIANAGRVEMTPNALIVDPLTYCELAVCLEIEPAVCNVKPGIGHELSGIVVFLEV